MHDDFEALVDFKELGGFETLDKSDFEALCFTNTANSMAQKFGAHSNIRIGSAMRALCSCEGRVRALGGCEALGALCCINTAISRAQRFRAHGFTNISGRLVRAL